MGLLTRTPVWLLVAASVSCTNGVSVDLSLVDGPRVLAVAATPAEAAPNASVTLAALWVDENGEHPDDALAWSRCTARRPLAELGPFASACLERESEAQVGLGVAPTVVAEMPTDVCRLFGPDPPPSQPGEPQGRPVDPDRTGGYYQPIVVEAGDEQAGYGVRLDCGVAGATQAQALELRMRHRDNLAPVLEELARVDGDALEIAVDEVLQVEAGANVELRIQWPECAENTSCGGAEWYPRFDAVTLEIVDTREAIAVAWYATAGELDAARTGRDREDPSRTSTNTWTAPAEPGAATLWIVLRDDRGGTSWRTLTVDVGAG